MINWFKDIIDREKTRQEKNSYKNKWKATQEDMVKKDDEIIALQKQIMAKNDRSRETYHLVKELKAEVKELRDYIAKRDFEEIKSDFKELKEENEEESRNVMEESKED